MQKWVWSAVMLGLVVAGSVSAQVPQFYWNGWTLGIGPGCGVCIYNQAGTQVGGFPLGLFSGAEVAKHPSGTVMVADSGAGTITAYTLGGAVASFAAAGVAYVAAHPSGDVLGLTQGFLLGPTVLTRYNLVGVAQWSTTLGVVLPAGVRCDSVGNAWVADALGGTLEWVDPAGVITGPITLPVAGQITEFDVDASGQCWVLVVAQGAATGNLIAVDLTGAITFNLGLNSNPAGFALDACGRPHVLNSLALPQTVDVIDPGLGGVVATTVLSTTDPHDAIAIDTQGNYWLSAIQLAGIAIFDKSGTRIGVVNGGAIPVKSSAGDTTGLRLVSVIDRTGDSDLDGFPNDREIALGSDPLDPGSVPLLLQVGGTVGAGSTYTVTGTVPSETGFPYVTGLSVGTGGIPLGTPDCRVIPLDFDALLLWWLSPASNAIATGQSGILDATGAGTVTVMLPPGSGFGGLPVYHAMATIDPVTQGVATISAERQVILP
ncbi:MAG: hypothetical protein CMJ83_16210 [Planctomycetes bacterium]|nr:hypothetical protein [Planctomycetota bacterium]